MNKNQFNIITQLQTELSSIFENANLKLSKAFNTAMNNIVEASDDSKKDGEEDFPRLKKGTIK